MDRFARIGAAIVAAVGAGVLLGWALSWPPLASAIPGLVAMKVNTACAFLAAGAALVLQLSAGARARAVGIGLAVFVTVLGGLTLAEYLLALDLGIDELLLPDRSQDSLTPHPGRMAPTTALGFLLAGLALCALRHGRPRYLLARSYWLVLPVLFLSAVAGVGYLYGVDSLYRVGPYQSMAVHTAGAFLLLSLAILAANRAGGIAMTFAGETAGGLVLRRLLPTLTLGFVALGWLVLRGEDGGRFDARFGAALLVVVSMAISILAVTSTAIRLHAVDVERELAEAQLLASHENLERRVLERTQELATTLAQVKQLSGLLPICAWCRKVRGDQDYWQSVEQFVAQKTDARFTHGICPECAERLEAEPPTAF